MRMMTSVSMLLRMIGAAIAVSLVKGLGMLALHGPHIGDGARYCRCRCRGWTRQVGARPRPLAADEIAIGGRDRALTGGHGFAVGRQAHRASRLAPFKTCIDKEPIDTLGNRVPLHGFRTRHDPGAYARRNFAATRNGRGSPQIAQPAIGA